MKRWLGSLASGEPPSFTRRALLVGAVQAAGISVLTGRLYQLQVMEGRRYAPLADDNRIDVTILAPVRGRILDRAGTVLAGNEESFSAVLFPSRTAHVEQSLDLYSRVVPVRADELAAIAARAAKARRGPPIVLATDLTFDQVATLNLLAPQLPGIETGTAYRRKYFYGDTVGHVTGYVGRVEQPALDDEPMLRLSTMKIGKAGVERGFEPVLRGQGGSRKFEVDARGRTIRYLEEVEPEAGRDVVLTLDLPLQTRVVERLRRESKAAVTVIDTATGDIVALASVPTYDPAVLTEKISETAWKELTAAEGRPLVNRAAAGLYPPGSTFKMVTALAALEAGVISLKEKIDCGGSYGLADQTFRCWKRQGHGRCDLHRALRESCDVYFYEIANRTGINAIAAMARRLGLGQIFDCGLPQQKKGVVPDSDWKKATLRKPWLAGETVLAGIGQGYVSTSPLQLAVMTARLATGRAVTPRLAIDEADDGRTPAFADLRLDPAALAAVRAGMVAVVNEDGGTGSHAQTRSGRVTVAGKTGTSQVVANSSRREDGAGQDTGPRDHALFVGYFPAQSPRYAVSAVVENGGGGGATAAPLVSDVIEFILADDPAARSMPGRPLRTRAADLSSKPARGT